MHLFSLSVSLLFLNIALYFYAKTRFSLLHLIGYLLLVATTVLLNFLYGISNYFTGDGINEATLYHIQYGLEGVDFGEYRKMVFSSIFVIIIILGIFWKITWLVYHKEHRKTSYTYITYGFLVLSIAFSPAVPDLHTLYSDSTARDKLTITNEKNFDIFYKKPFIKQIGKKMNLVFIYAESLEQTYSNEEVFPGLTVGLNRLEKSAVSFARIQQVFGTNFTIAGFVASQCGIPLVGPVYGNSMSGMDTYLPRAICLGDLLKSQGYHVVDYGGADLGFAGKGLFLKTHGFDEMRGLQELLSFLPIASYKNSWGLYDDSLFDLSFTRYSELSENQSPFALFILTLDTHQPNESPSASCQNIQYGDGSNLTLNTVACSDHLITKFVDQILASPHAADTVIVIASDHLAPYNPIKGSDYVTDRNNKFMILTPEAFESKKVSALGSTLDIGSTLLPFLGFTGEIGLGRNLLNPQQSGLEISAIQKQIPSWKNSLSHFWDFPQISDQIQIRPQEKSIEISGRNFRIPVLIELNSNLETNLKFQFDLEFDTSGKKGERDLISLTKKLDKSTPFMLINNCEEIQMIQDGSYDSDFCLLAGKGKDLTVIPLTKNYTISTRDIVELTNITLTEP